MKCRHDERWSRGSETNEISRSSSHTVSPCLDNLCNERPLSLAIRFKTLEKQAVLLITPIASFRRPRRHYNDIMCFTLLLLIRSIVSMILVFCSSCWFIDNATIDSWKSEVTNTFKMIRKMHQCCSLPISSSSNPCNNIMHQRLIHHGISIAFGAQKRRLPPMTRRRNVMTLTHEYIDRRVARLPLLWWTHTR